MRIAIISDTHFGDSDSQLVYITEDKKEAVLGEKYNTFKKVVKDEIDKCEYLILAGDILDFSIASYEKAYRCAKKFFEQIRDDKLTDKVIYIAGNHDADIWHIVQHQRHVINKIAKGELSERLERLEFRHSVAGILDDRSNNTEKCKLTLDDVTVRPDDEKKYGGMFLDGIAKGITFYFAYPNLYIVTDTESVSVTHGQYLETYWSFMGELAEKIAGNDLCIGDIEEMVELNFPLNQLACTGIGQAGKLTDNVIRPVQKDVKKVKNYLKNLENVTEKRFAKLIVRGLVRAGGDWLIAKIEKIESARYNKDFLQKNENRVRKFYNAGLSEIASINSKPPFNTPNRRLPVPGKILFGHTHLPTPWEKPDRPFSDGLSFYNTGGWVTEKSGFKGAEIFFYETNRGFWSKSIKEL